MSWLARRHTTRIEDMAYCMLGIFGVHMAPLYGEGKNAFQRLQIKLLQISDDESIFAWKSSPYSSTTQPERGMLADSPDEFGDAGDVVRIHRSSMSTHYSMTNKGLLLKDPRIFGQYGNWDPQRQHIRRLELQCKRKGNSAPIVVFLMHSERRREACRVFSGTLGTHKFEFKDDTVALPVCNSYDNNIDSIYVRGTNSGFFGNKGLHVQMHVDDRLRGRLHDIVPTYTTMIFWVQETRNDFRIWLEGPTSFGIIFKDLRSHSIADSYFVVLLHNFRGQLSTSLHSVSSDIIDDEDSLEDFLYGFRRTFELAETRDQMVDPTRWLTGTGWTIKTKDSVGIRARIRHADAVYRICLELYRVSTGNATEEIEHLDTVE